MKRIFLLCLSLLLSLCFWGQEHSHLLQSEKRLISIGQASVLDPYLSQLSYDGFSLAILRENSSLISERKTDYSKRSRLFLKGGTAFNPSKTGSILLTKFRYDWGMYRHFSPVTDLLILGGAYSDFDLGIKYNARNSNNPVSFDAATNINLSLRCLYDFHLFKLRDKLRIELLVEMPLIGFMFAPPHGLSYYEMSLSKSFLKQLHFSSLHNKQGGRIALNLDLPLGNAVYSLGLSSEKVLYTAHGLVLKERDFLLSLGYVIKFSVFTRKHPAPLNFLTY